MTHRPDHLIKFFEEVPKLKMSKLSIITILEKVDLLNKSNTLRHKINGIENKKAKFCRILIPWFGSLALA